MKQSSPLNHMTCDDLYGIRRTVVSSIQKWLANPKGILIISGPCGSGKTSLALGAIQDSGMEPLHSTSASPRNYEEMTRLLGILRSPSFTNQKRALILDDADSIDKQAWNVLLKDTSTRMNPDAIILATHDIQTIPWTVRKDQRVVELSFPDMRHKQEWLADRGTEHTGEDCKRIAEESRSWRQLQHNLSMTPPGRAPNRSTDVIVKLPDVQQPIAILGGNQKGPSSVNVLRIIQSAEFNHADAKDVRLAQWMESRTWHAAGLAKVSRRFAEMMRSKYRDVKKTPFRKRRINNRTR